MVVSPQEWGAQVDYDTWDDPFTPDDGVALHHGGGGNYLAHLQPYSQANEIQQLQQWEGYHLYGKGWRGLAYGWAVGQTGTIYRIRGWNRYGAHTGDVDGDGIANNDEIVPLLFIGSGSRVRLSPAAQESIEWLRRNVIEVRSPNAKRLYGHQEITQGTTCPGQFGMEYVRAHRLLPEEDMPLNEADLHAIRQLIREELEITDAGVSLLEVRSVWNVPHGGRLMKDNVVDARKAAESVDGHFEDE